jgi:SAM-dependent methyltransferase
MIYLDLGSNKTGREYRVNKPDFTCVDIREADVYQDLGKFPWPFENNSIDGIFASHILEHFSKENGMLFLQECWRILKDKAPIRIAVPDMDKFIYGHVTNDWSWSGDYKLKSLDGFMGNSNDPELYMRHYYMYCFASLSFSLTKIGFKEPKQISFNESMFDVFVGIDNPNYSLFSLYVEAAK